MIIWYIDKKLGVLFDNIPQVGIRYILPSDTGEIKKSKQKYPFINKKNLKIELHDFVKQKNYFFEIPKGYCYDGASIPRLFWRIIGANTDNRFLIPALIHDVLCEHHDYVNNDRHFADSVFESLLSISDVSKFKRKLMFMAVECYQCFCNW